jgi:hypothetical protein
VAAEMLECTVKELRALIERDDQLRPIYGARGFGSEVPLPTPQDVRNRTQGENPEGTESSDIDLAEIVSENDTNVMRLGLKKMGASPDLLKSLKHLDNLATSGGKFLAVCLQTTHRMHFVQTIGTFDLAARIKKILDDDDLVTEQEKKLSHEDRRGYYELYLDMQAATGQAYNLTLKGTESMVRMLMAANKRGFGKKAAKAGFGVMVAEGANGEAQT